MDDLLEDAPVQAGRIPLAAVRGGAIAIAANLSLYLVATWLLGLPLPVPNPVTGAVAPLPAMAMVFATAVGALGGALTFAVLARVVRRPRRTFLIVSVAFTIISFASPAVLPTDLATILVLEIAHVLAAVPVTLALLRDTR
jgi:hypothetical protein